MCCIFWLLIVPSSAALGGILLVLWISWRLFYVRNVQNVSWSIQILPEWFWYRYENEVNSSNMRGIMCNTVGKISTLGYYFIGAQKLSLHDIDKVQRKLSQSFRKLTVCTSCSPFLYVCSYSVVNVCIHFLEIWNSNA